MNESTKKEILIALDIMCRRYPDWRFGQLIANISCWAVTPTEKAVWDVEDEAFLKAVVKHLEGPPDPHCLAPEPPAAAP